MQAPNRYPVHCHKYIREVLHTCFQRCPDRFELNVMTVSELRKEVKRLSKALQISSMQELQRHDEYNHNSL